MTDVHALSGAYAIDALDDAERRQFEVLDNSTTCFGQGHAVRCSKVKL